MLVYPTLMREEGERSLLKSLDSGVPVARGHGVEELGDEKAEVRDCLALPVAFL